MSRRKGSTPLTPRQLAWSCPPAWLPFRTTAQLESPEELRGQPGALGAVTLGVRIRARGYNIYVAGAPGTGRSSLVRRVIEHEPADGVAVDDLCYTQNFADPRSPRLLRLPAGKGRVLRDRLAAAAEKFTQGVAALRASGAHRRQREKVSESFRARHAEVLGAFQAEVQAQGFATVELNLGPYRRHDIAPVVEGQPVPFDDLDNLLRAAKIDQPTAERFRETHPVLAARLAETTAQLRQIGQDLQSALVETDSEAARPLVDEVLAEVRAALGLKPGKRAELDAYLGQVAEFLLGVCPVMFALGERVAGEGGEEPVVPDLLEALKVVVLVDRTGQSGRPIIEEPNPTPARLLGAIDVQRTPDGAIRADLGGIRAGALHLAHGGFLLLNAHELVAAEGAWNALRRALRVGAIGFQAAFAAEGPPPLTPEPTPLDLTVILIGSPALRDALAQNDEEFSKLFKITAVLDERVPLTREAVGSYAGFVAKLARDESLLPLEADAVARLLEFMVRLGGSRKKLSTRFRWLADLGRESSWFARQDGARAVQRSHVARALEARREREGLLAARILESIAEGVLRLELSGEQLGQVNALAVVETTLERFGYPVRITATTSVGRSGIIDIEREAELSGEIHTKASLILAGFLRSRFAQRHPLAITASVCFEQSYGGVEGDSASSAELVALLSSLSGLPLRQDLAVTGAVDQHGNVLAVGGTNEKIEGFWRVCRGAGLSGTQGVIVPAASVDTLQLDPLLVEDVQAGRFTVYAVERVAELVELLTGTPLGEPDHLGRWPAGSVGERIAVRLAEMAELMRAYGEPGPA